MQAGKVRIIGGKLKGRKITVPKVDAVRPTTDRVRETVFNWLQPYIYNATCLDAFAGSGVLGIEAISRGAKVVTLVEHNKKVVQVLQQTVALLSLDNAEVINGDFFTTASQFTVRFDVVFLDPPFSANLLAQCFEFLVAHDLLNEKALIYCEQNAHSKFTPAEEFAPLKVKRYGDVEYSLWQKVSA